MDAVIAKVEVGLDDAFNKTTVITFLHVYSKELGCFTTTPQFVANITSIVYYFHNAFLVS